MNTLQIIITILTVLVPWVLMLFVQPSSLTVYIVTQMPALMLCRTRHSSQRS